MHAMRVHNIQKRGRMNARYEGTYGVAHKLGKGKIDWHWLTNGVPRAGWVGTPPALLDIGGSDQRPWKAQIR